MALLLSVVQSVVMMLLLCVFQNVVNNSDHQAVLQLVDLVAGHYVFTLTVTDELGLSSKDSTSLLVKHGQSGHLDL